MNQKNRLVKRAIRMMLSVANTFILGLFLARIPLPHAPTQKLPVATELQTVAQKIDAAMPFQEQTAEEIVAEYSYIQDKCGGIVAYHTGKYINYQYGFSVNIPEKMVGLDTPPPMPQHGFHIDLSPRMNVDARVYVSAYGNALLWTSLSEAVASNLEWSQEDRRKVLILEQSPTRLGQYRAIHYVVQYTSIKSGETMIDDETIAMRPESQDSQIVYEIGLLTPKWRYSEDKKVLERIIKSWNERPVY